MEDIIDRFKSWKLLNSEVDFVEERDSRRPESAIPEEEAGVETWLLGSIRVLEGAGDGFRFVFEGVLMG
jgi:hypothetical protein